MHAVSKDVTMESKHWGQRGERGMHAVSKDRDRGGHSGSFALSDPVALTYQAERMPDPIRLKVGQAPPAQAAVFDEFARNIPGFKPLTEREAQQMTINKPAVGGGVAGAGENVPGNAGGPSVSASEDCVAILDEVHSKLQPFIEQCTSLPPAPHMQALNQLLEALHIARTSKEVSSVIVLIGKAVESLLEGLTPGIQTEPEMLARFRDANILVLRFVHISIIQSFSQ